MPYLLLSDNNSRIHTLRLGGSGAGLTLTPIPGYLRSRMWFFGKTMDLDGNLLAMASADGVQLWSLANPESPQLLSTIPGTVGHNTLALRRPFLWASIPGSQGYAGTWDVSDPLHPAPYAPETWALAQPWNAAHFSMDNSAAFVGRTLFCARHSQLQVFKCKAAPVTPPALLLDTSRSQDDPWVRRAMASGAFQWHGQTYLAVAVGNELQLWSVDAQGNAHTGSSSNFAVPPFGDRDYNLFNFAVADDCRFGLAGYETAGLVHFDLGTGTVPRFTDHVHVPQGHRIGGLAFRLGADCYLISSAAGDHWDTVYLVRGLRDLLPVAQVRTENGTAYTVISGTLLA